jgi:hypothetical protein
MLYAKSLAAERSASTVLFHELATTIIECEDHQLL